MERYWDIVSRLAGVTKIFFNTGMIGLFLKPFLSDKARTKFYVPKFIFPLQVWLGAGFYLCAMLVCYLIPVNMAVSFAHIIGSAALFLGLEILDREDVNKKIFLSVSVYLLVWIASGISTFIWGFLWKLTVDHPYAAGKDSLQFGFYTFVMCFHVVMENLILYFMICLLHRAYPWKKEGMSGKELLLLLSPYFSILTGYWTIRFLLWAYESDTKSYVWISHDGYRFFLLFYEVMSFLAILSGIMSYQQIKSAQEERLSQTVLSEQVKELKSHVAQVEKLYQGIRGMKHDLNSHIMVMQDLYRRGEYEEAEKYLSDMKKESWETDFDVKTGNPVTDVILSEKQKEAGDQGIHFENHFSCPEHGNPSTYDISVILSNILSNAIDGAKESKDKYIKISSGMRGEVYFIEVRNSFDGILIIDDDTLLPPTTKFPGEGHGFGMQNVRRIAEKYYGAVDIGQEGHEVTVMVMMVIPGEAAS